MRASLLHYALVLSACALDELQSTAHTSTKPRGRCCGLLPCPAVPFNWRYHHLSCLVRACALLVILCTCRGQGSCSTCKQTPVLRRNSATLQYFICLFVCPSVFLSLLVMTSVSGNGFMFTHTEVRTVKNINAHECVRYAHAWYYLVSRVYNI